MKDEEFSEDSLRLLYDLNGVIASTGEPLAGNLFYEHHEEGYQRTPPNPSLKPKRDRFRAAMSGRTRLLEVGVNGGHSAFLALTSNPKLEFHGVDICEHSYVRPAVNWLRRSFPGRVFFYPGDGRRVLPQLVNSGSVFDAFHIDGAKFTYFDDICNSQRLLRGGALIVVDDSNIERVERLWGRCVRWSRIRPTSEFPSMSPSERYRNQIGELMPATIGGQASFRLSLPVRRLRWSQPIRLVEPGLRRYSGDVVAWVRRRG